MENEIMITVLNEVLAEQKEMQKRNEALEKQVASLKSLNHTILMKLDVLKIEIPPVDLRQTETLVAKNCEEIKAILQEQPKNVTQVKRYLLFPEHNASEYYGYIMRWVLYIFIATYSYWLVQSIIEKWK